MRTVREMLTVALNELDTAGWCQNAGRDTEGRICLGNALVIGRGMPHVLPFSFFEGPNYSVKEWEDALHGWSESHRIVWEVIVTLFPERAADNSIPGFNDNPQTTLEDIRLVLKTAIEAAG